MTVKKKDGEDNAGGAKQLGALLTYTDLIDEFVAKMGEDFDPTSEQFILGLQKRLPGKFVKAEHNVKEDKMGKNFDLKGFMRFSSSGAGAAKVEKGPATTAPAADAGADAGWD